MPPEFNVIAVDEMTQSIEELFGEQPPQTFLLYAGKYTLYYDDASHTYWFQTAQGKQIIPNCTTILDTLDKSFMLMRWAVRTTIESLEESFEMDKWIVEDYGKTYTKKRVQEFLETARKSSNTKKNKAADIGHLAHAWLEAYGKLRSAGHSHDYTFAKLHDFSVKGVHVLSNDAAASCVQAALNWFQEHHVVFLHCEVKCYSEQDNACGTIDVIALVDGILTIIDYKSSNYLYDTHRFQTAFYGHARTEEHPEEVFKQRILLRLGKDDGEFEAHVFDDEDEYIGDYMAFRGLLMAYERVQDIKNQARAEKAQAKAEKKQEKELEKQRVKDEKAAAKLARKS